VNEKIKSPTLYKPHPVIVAPMVDTPNWFRTWAESNFRAICMDETYIKRLDELHFLQLGAFAGHASEWIGKYLLTNPASTLTDVDTWAGSDEPEHEKINFARIETEYDVRVAEFGDKVRKYKMTTAEWFRLSPPTKQPFDFIYIDADHTAIGVLEDAVASHRLLKVGGLLVFDDYTWIHPTNRTPYVEPKFAIDAFMKVYGNKYEIVVINAQAWLRRIA